MTNSERLSHFEAMSADARERGVSLLHADYLELGRLKEAVRLEQRAIAKSKEGAK